MRLYFSGGAVPHDLTVAAAMLYVMVVMRTSPEGQSFEIKVTEVTSNWLSEGTNTPPFPSPSPPPPPSSPPRLLPGALPSAGCLPCPPRQATTFAVATGYSGAAPAITTLPHYLPPLQQVEECTAHQFACLIHASCVLGSQRPVIATSPLVP